MRRSRRSTNNGRHLLTADLGALIIFFAASSSARSSCCATRRRQVDAQHKTKIKTQSQTHRNTDRPASLYPPEPCTSAALPCRLRSVEIFKIALASTINTKQSQTCCCLRDISSLKRCSWAVSPLQSRSTASCSRRVSRTRCGHAGVSNSRTHMSSPCT